MRSTKIVALCLACLLAASAAFAAAGAPKAGPRPAKPAPAGDDAPAWWGRAPDAPPAARGIVAAISPARIDVQTPQGTRSFAINEQTRISVRGQKATVNDVKVNDPVGVRFKPVENALPLALGITVPKPGVGGEIVSVQGGVVTLRDKTGVESRVMVTQATKISSRGYEGTLGDLRPGYRATARGEAENDVVTAQQIEFVPAVARGTVVAKNGDLITVKTVRQAELQVQGSAATSVLIRPRVDKNRKGTLADIQVGMPVNIGFHPAQGAPAPLLWIDVLTGS